MLLQWAQLEPQGHGDLAVVRFSSPVCVRTLRIYPTGSRPFKLQEDIVAETKPSSFYLDIYFNAQPISTDGRPKPKPSNALVPTSVAYQGGQVDFTVDSGNNEFASRLMIVRGKFEKLSMAIYGDLVPEATNSPQAYMPKQLPQLSNTLLPPALDPANDVNPTSLAESLLTLIPPEERPNLTLIVRLMFCLKPSNEDWEEKDFPHLYSDLDQEIDDFKLERAVEMTSRPVSDSIDEGILREFAARLGSSVADYNDDEAYFLAKLLSQCAPQHPSLVRFILDYVDLVRMYSEPNLDRPTLLYLLDAAANWDVSRQLNNQETLNAIVHIRDNASYDDGARRAANKLYNRIKGWDVLEDSLLNTQAAFGAASQLIREITAEENSFGIWVENMISNSDILDRLAENPPVQLLPHPPVMWQGRQIVSHGEFIAFLRAAVGVAAVVAVYAWADSVPVEGCRERTLAVLRLWQNVNGYREIVNHFLLMRQMAYRLECMLPLDDDLPSQAGIDAEHILKTLALQPSSMLRPDFVKVMQNLQAPLNYMADNEVLEFKRASGVAKEGLSGAIRLLAKMPDEYGHGEKRLDLRIAIAIVLDVLSRHSSGEKELLETVWDQGLNGLPTCLIRHLEASSVDLRMQFGLPVPSRSRRAHLEVTTIFLSCLDLLRLLAELVTSYPPPSRDFISLTKSVVDIYVCTDTADNLYTQESAVCAAAHSTRQVCSDMLASLVVPSALNAQTCSASRSVLKTLLTHASTAEAHDAAHHMTQSFWLFDHALPLADSAVWGSGAEEARAEWLRQVLPSILQELRTFYEMQEIDNKLHLIRRFKGLDEGSIGVAEWLLFRELQTLENATKFLQTSSNDSLEQRAAFWGVTNAANVIYALVQSTADTSQWALRTLLQGENSRLLQSSLDELLDTDVSFGSITNLAIALSPYLAETDRQLQTVVMTVLFRATRAGQYTVFASLINLLNETNGPLFDEKAGLEFGEALERLTAAIRNGEDLPSDLAGTVFGVLERVTPLNRSSGVFAFRNLTQKSYDELVRWLVEALPTAKRTKLEAMRLRWTFAGEPRPPPLFIAADYTLELSLDNWDMLLTPPVPVPSTPVRRSPAQSAEMIGMITVSPPNALLRSPEVKGLTKTYANNAFRELRQQSTSRQNTSRLPSRHVDDFEQGSSSIAPLNLGISASPPPPLTFPHPHPSLPMNPMYYQR